MGTSLNSNIGLSRQRNSSTTLVRHICINILICGPLTKTRTKHSDKEHWRFHTVVV